eukprot:145882-Pleurochrysis_carterae.AAC.2
MLCRFMHNPSMDCYYCAKELLHYLYSTKSMTLVLGGKTFSLPHFDTFRGACALEINHNEFEQRITGIYGLHFTATLLLPLLRSAGVAARRNTFLRNLLGHLLDAISTRLSGGATVLLLDNSAAVKQTDHAGASKKTEHYNCWEYYLRECQLDGLSKAHFIRTCDQVADCLTKVLDKTTCLKLRQHLTRKKQNPPTCVVYTTLC